MSNVLEFYHELGFEETEIEDRLTALFVEIEPEGDYALLTTEDGTIPTNLKQAIVFACYTPEGSFLWSTSFKNSHDFHAIWSQESKTLQKFEAIKNHRDNKTYYKTK